jgi:hypothetical protein
VDAAQLTACAGSRVRYTRKRPFGVVSVSYRLPFPC